MNFENITDMAQKISFAFEDNYSDKEKRSLFIALFNRYLMPVDPAETMEPYEAIILLGRKYPIEYEKMVNEMQESSLI